ncbi:MAG: hypothetical protein GKR87_16090 [Kiritimatiellae bacterium]|nr:hypothetical protein [Kiritimatiellia bacterium]NKB25856.1 hypothetical protein [Kiritimatiellia bacterium]
MRTTFWDKETKKFRHTQHRRITGCSVKQLKILQLSFREKVIPANDSKALAIRSSKELGASQSILKLAKDLRLDRLLYSRDETWVKSVMAMVVGRIIYQGSKLSPCNLSEQTCLWALCGVDEKPCVEKHSYDPLDRLLKRQNAIQKKLVARHLQSDP